MLIRLTLYLAGCAAHNRGFQMSPACVIKFRILFLQLAGACLVCTTFAQDANRSRAEPPWPSLAPLFSPPPEFATDFGAFKSPLIFNDNRRATNATAWRQRRTEILNYWHEAMGPWPPLIAQPKLEYIASTNREHFLQHRVRLEIAPQQHSEAYLLLPKGHGPFPAVIVPFYDPETSVALGKAELRDFAFQLTRRGFVSLSLGSPGGDARQPTTGGARCQPLSFLAYVAADAFNALTNLAEVDSRRIGIVGHSYGGKWAMFASCLDERFACAAWSDPGIVFDEARANVNYWEPWYLGEDPTMKRKPGVIAPDKPRTGPYKRLMAEGHDLHELHALMAPRPFLVSGGSEDPPQRWQALNHSVTVNQLLGQTNRVAMSNRTGHNPTVESNEQIYRFFEYWLQPARPNSTPTN